MASAPVLNLAARRAVEYLDTVANRPVVATAAAAELRAALGGPLPPTGQDAASIINRLADAANTGTVATQGPRYFGFVVGGSLPASTAADWLVSAWDQNAGIYVLSPLVSVVEEVVSEWLRDLVGVPDATVGFVTGCQMANFTCLAVARHHVLAAAGWDVEADGLSGAPALDVVVSDESHYTIFNALRYLGLGSSRVHRVPTDDQGRMKASELDRVLSARSGPCIVAAQAGNVNTGAFDPIGEVADACERRRAWLHVDGAFGLWALASPSRAHLVADIARADSIATDAHKWLNVPYDCGIAMTRHRDAHRTAMTLHAAYIESSDAQRDPHEYVPEESRRGRAVTVYAALASLGRDGLRDLVERCCAHAQRMASRLSAHRHVRILNDVVLNQVLVRIEPDGGLADSLARPLPDSLARGDQATRAVIAAVQQEGTCWLGGTTWHGMAAMRVSIANWSTTEADIDRSAQAILRAIDDLSS